MASLNDIRQEALKLNRIDAWDVVRRKYLAELEAITGRNTITYAADFISPHPAKVQAAGNMIPVSLADKEGFDEVTEKLTGEKLDVIIHSPGGSAEAAESIVSLLRARFSDIRFIVPNAAKSAATMLALSGNQIVMDEMSELGPTDPQMILFRDGQQLYSPAQAIKDQFEKAQGEINSDPSKLPSWVPILREFGPSLLAECDNHIALGYSLIKQWTQTYMFGGEPDADAKSTAVAQFFSYHNNFGSHGRRIGIDQIEPLGVKVIDMRNEAPLRLAVQHAYRALAETLRNTGAVKIVENTKGDASVTLVEMIQMQPSGQPQQQPHPKGQKSAKAPQLPRNRR